MTILLITIIGMLSMTLFLTIVTMVAILDIRRGRGNSIVGKNRIVGSRDYKAHARTNAV